LLARHRAIDTALEGAIEQRKINQVIEVAAGLSPRGWRFAKRYPQLTYVDADLPGMTGRKRRALEQMSSDPQRHLVRELDVLQEEGLTAIAGELDQREGLVIVTEGLLPYLPTDQVEPIWRRFATTLSGFARGAYVSDIHVGAAEGAPEQAFRLLLALFVRGRVSVHFESSEQVVAALQDAGFAAAEVRAAQQPARDRASRIAHILEASVR
jgi:O-methyltransferase involved in polyketide biosynthesis